MNVMRTRRNAPNLLQRGMCVKDSINTQQITFVCVLVALKKQSFIFSVTNEVINNNK